MTSEANIDIRVDDTQVEQLTRSLNALQQETRQVATGFDAVERQSTSAKSDVDRLDQSVKKLDRNMGELSRSSRTGASGLASIGRTAAGVALGVAGLDSAVAAIQRTIDLAKTSVAAYAATNDETAQSLGRLQTAIGLAQVSLGELIVSALGGSDAIDNLANLVTETAGALAILADAFATGEGAAESFAVTSQGLAVSLAETYVQIVNTFGALENLGARIRFYSPGAGIRGFFLNTRRLNEQLEETETRSREAEEYLERVRNSTLDVDAAMARATRSTQSFNRALGERPAGGTAGTAGAGARSDDDAAARAERQQQAEETAEVYNNVFRDASRELTANIINLADHYMRIAEVLGGQEGRTFMEAIFYNPPRELIEGQRQMGLLGGVAERMGNIPEQLERTENVIIKLQKQLDDLLEQQAQQRAESLAATQAEAEAAQDLADAEERRATALEIANRQAQIGRRARLQGVQAELSLAGGAAGGALFGGAASATAGQAANLARIIGVGQAPGLAGAAARLGIGAAGAAGSAAGGAALIAGGSAIGFQRAAIRNRAIRERQERLETLSRDAYRASREAQNRADQESLNIESARARQQAARLNLSETESDIDSRIAVLGIAILNNERERDRLRRAAGPQLEQYNQALEATNETAQEGLDEQIGQARELAQILAGQAGERVGGPVVAVAQGIATGTAVRSQADIRQLQSSAQTLRRGIGFRADIDRAQGIREFGEADFSTLPEAEDALIATLNRREQALIAGGVAIQDYIVGVNTMKAATKEAFKQTGIEQLEAGFASLGEGIGNALGGGFENGLSAGEKAKIVLFELLGSILNAMGATAIAQGTIATFGDPAAGGFPNPARGAALYAAGTAAIAVGTAFSAKAGNIRASAGGGDTLPTPGDATTPGRSGGGEAITNIIVENRFGSRFDAREMDRAAATSFERAAAAGQA